MTDLIFPSDFKQIEAIASEDVLLINDASQTTGGTERNFTASIEQITNFIRTQNGAFRGIADPNTKYERLYKDEYYFAFKKGTYAFVTKDNTPITLKGDSLCVIQTTGDFYECVECLNTSTFADINEVNKQIASLQPENYLQKNAMQDDELTTFDFSHIEEEDKERFFRFYDNGLSASERLSFSLVKGALQTYVKQQMALYPTFTDMYNAIGSIMGGGDSNSLAKQVSILQAEMQQTAIPFSKQEKVQIKWTFNHVPKTLILDAQGNEVIAAVQYHVSEKWLEVTLNPDEVAEGVIYVS